MRAAGGRLVGISADPLLETREWQADEEADERVRYPLLSDADLRVAKAYGLHDADGGIALPAVVIVRHDDGRIAWLRVSETVGDRPSTEEVLEALRALPRPVARDGVAPVRSR